MERPIRICRSKKARASHRMTSVASTHLTPHPIGVLPQVVPPPKNIRQIFGIISSSNDIGTICNVKINKGREVGWCAVY